MKKKAFSHMNFRVHKKRIEISGEHTTSEESVSRMSTHIEGLGVHGT